MKTIIYLLIAIFSFGIIANGFKNQSGTKNSILIQSTDNKISSVTLSQSAKIISGRLQSINSGKFELKIIPEQHQIQVIFTDNLDLKTVERLLTQQGAFAFYATDNHKRFVELLKGDNHLFSLLNANNADHSTAEIGCTTVAGVEKVNEYLNSLALNQKCKFVWSQPSEDSEVCLYALRLNNAKGALLTGLDIENIKFNQEKASENYNIAIEFKRSAVAIWADATKRNINNAIAIVLDNQVIFTPTVKSVIEGGKCEITGKFSQAQARYFAALGNNGELPVSFKVIR
jgi:preprotein translocase subunit SecD